MSYNLSENFGKRLSTALAVFLVFSFFITPLTTVLADDETSSDTGTTDTSTTDTTGTTNTGSGETYYSPDHYQTTPINLNQ